MSKQQPSDVNQNMTCVCVCECMMCASASNNMLYIIRYRCGWRWCMEKKQKVGAETIFHALVKGSNITGCEVTVL